MAPRTTKPPSKTKADFLLPTLIELFILSKQIEGRSPKTLSWYQANLERFSDFLAGEHMPALQEITLDNARTFVAHLQGKSTRYEEHHMRPTEKGGLSPHSVHAYVRTFKTFGRWLVEEGYVEVHPFERLKPPRLPDTMIEVLSDAWWPLSVPTRCWGRGCTLSCCCCWTQDCGPQSDLGGIQLVDVVVGLLPVGGGGGRDDIDRGAVPIASAVVGPIAEPGSSLGLAVSSAIAIP